MGVRPRLQQHLEQLNIALKVSRKDGHPDTLLLGEILRGTLGIRICPSRQQHATDGHPPTSCSQVKRGLSAFLLPSIHIGAFSNQLLKFIQIESFPFLVAKPQQPKDRRLLP
ncbi:hypothetical protein A7Y00_03780 [Stenotrophomonas maltophilia]|nr:hypothetical protein A7Y00_03780 [Stenotrophomonas maltophilia]